MVQVIERKTARELQRDDYILVLDSQDLEAIKDHVGLEEMPTAAVVTVVDGDYGEVWVTYWNRPWELGAVYERVV